METSVFIRLLSGSPLLCFDMLPELEELVLWDHVTTEDLGFNFQIQILEKEA